MPIHLVTQGQLLLGVPLSNAQRCDASRFLRLKGAKSNKPLLRFRFGAVTVGGLYLRTWFY